jgi:hypothetical protein
MAYSTGAANSSNSLAEGVCSDFLSSIRRSNSGTSMNGWTWNPSGLPSSSNTSSSGMYLDVSKSSSCRNEFLQSSSSSRNFFRVLSTSLDPYAFTCSATFAALCGCSGSNILVGFTIKPSIKSITSSYVSILLALKSFRISFLLVCHAVNQATTNETAAVISSDQYGNCDRNSGTIITYNSGWRLKSRMA